MTKSEKKQIEWAERNLRAHPMHVAEAMAILQRSSARSSVQIADWIRAHPELLCYLSFVNGCFISTR